VVDQCSAGTHRTVWFSVYIVLKTLMALLICLMGFSLKGVEQADSNRQEQQNKYFLLC